MVSISMILKNTPHFFPRVSEDGVEGVTGNPQLPGGYLIDYPPTLARMCFIKIVVVLNSDYGADFPQ